MFRSPSPGTLDGTAFLTLHTHPGPMPPLLATVSLLELLLFLVAIFLYFQKNRYSIPDSFCYATAIVFSFYSSIIQLFFILKVPNWFYPIDFFLFSISLFYIIRNYKEITSFLLHLSKSFCKNRIILLPFALIYFYLLAQALLLPVSEWDCLNYNLPRVLMMIEEGSLFLKNFTKFHQANFFLGSDILHYMFLRFHADWFSGFFSFLSYTVVILGNYSLANKIFQNDKLSLVTALIIGSMVELVLQSTSAKNDIPLAAMSTICFLSAYNFIITNDSLHIIVLFISLLYGLSVKAYFFGFAIPFLGLFIFLYYNEIIKLKGKISSYFIKRFFFLLSILLLLFITLTVFLFNNYQGYGSIFGDRSNIDENINPDGLPGAGLNALRYFVQMSGLPKELGGNFITEVHDKILGRYKDIGKAKMTIESRSFDTLTTSLLRPPDENASWHGPLAFFLVLPAIIYSLIRGASFLRLVALSLLFFYFAICYKVGYMPWNNRFFSLFFAGGGICVAFFLRNAVRKQLVFNFLIFFSLGILIYAASFNRLKPLINLRKVGDVIHSKIRPIDNFQRWQKVDAAFYGYDFLNWTYFVAHRDGYFRLYHQDDRVAFFTENIKSNTRLLLIGDGDALVFPFLISRPDIKITVANAKQVLINGKITHFSDLNDLIALKNNYDYFLFINVSPFSLLDESKLILKRKGKFKDSGELEIDSIQLFDYSS